MNTHKMQPESHTLLHGQVVISLWKIEGFDPEIAIKYFIYNIEHSSKSAASDCDPLSQTAHGTDKLMTILLCNY